MAAVSSSQTTATNYANVNGGGYDQDNASSWDRAGDHAENYGDFDFGLGNDAGTDSRSQTANRRVKSPDSFAGNGYDDGPATTNGPLSPTYDSEGPGPAKGKSDDDHGGPDPIVEHSKWIHRDKLARIESEELQAAGIFVPRSRAPSKQRHDRSRSAMRRGTDASDQTSHHSRSRKNSTVVDQQQQPPQRQDVAIPVWDLRTPEEIAEEEANAYFTTNALGTSRIPVAKTSPAPISLDTFERGSTASRKHSESPEEDGISMAKTRSRSASASLRTTDRNVSGSTLAPGKRSAADMSPKKNSNTGKRQASGGAKNSAAGAGGRPKTRSGSANGTRPSTRSGESPPNKQPEGDPPWLVNSYKPDPRLPPDQQLLPTVARRLQQEKWEKEGTYGDVYDRDFRPLNDRAFLKPPEAGEHATATEEDQKEQQGQTGEGEWPLRPDQMAKSPSLRQGSYSTMPKISDKSPTSPLASPRAPSRNQQPPTQQQPPPQVTAGQNGTQSQAPERAPVEKQDDGKRSGGCGCCVVM